MNTTAICFPALGILALCSLPPAVAAPGQVPPEKSEQAIDIREGLVIEPPGKYGRRPFHTDALEAQLIEGTFSAPRPDLKLTLPDGGICQWRTLTSNENGWFEDPALRGGYFYATVELPAARTMILDASGHRLVYVNGEIRAGDTYQNGLLRLPVPLKSGRNEFLFRGARGRLKARLLPVAAPLFITARDTTLPDLIVGEPVDVVGGLVVIHASDSAVDDLEIHARTADGRYQGSCSVGPLVPFSMRKARINLRGPPPTESGSIKVAFRLRCASAKTASDPEPVTIELAVREASAVHKRTFISSIDGSVQYYAVNPARASEAAPTPAVVFSLHGAGVEATNQARSYAAKSWAHIVAPTNRRPFGFDWEDWGRRDGLEVMAHALGTLPHDPQRIYLTGHSMGGHGVWHLAATFPDRFAAIGPSAGWISFRSYTGQPVRGEDTPIGKMLRRAGACSDTLSLSRNYRHHGIYILHGEADDNVPVDQARTIREHLAEFHTDVASHEQPGAGHWWDASDEPGVDCVDWAAMFDFFARRRIPARAEIREVEFVTANPGVSSRCHWVSIEALQQLLMPGSVALRYDPGRRRFAGSSHNVSRMALDLAHVPAGGPLSIELDGQSLQDVSYPASSSTLWLTRTEGRWQASLNKPPANLKGPQRYGPFKEVFNHRVLFVYGTSGDARENAWSLAKARYDAETFYYRGNASVDVIPDTQFSTARAGDRNVVLYGNADTNRAWPALLANCPVQISRGQVLVGERLWLADNLGCLLIYPRADRQRAVVGVVGGSGVVGMRLTERLPYFVSGVAYPDFTLLSPEVLQHEDAGIEAAGFFGTDWQMGSGDFVYRKPAAPNPD